MYIEEEKVKWIGEDLGELLNWNVVEPYLMVQVMVECDALLVLFQETISENGETFRIRFEYLKLQNHCKVCFRLTHDTRSCTARVEANQNHRER